MNWQRLEEAALDSLRMDVYFYLDDPLWHIPGWEIQVCGAEQLLAEIYGYTQ